MSYYEQLLKDSGFLRGITNEVPNSSEPYSEEASLARFEYNIEVRNNHVAAKLAAGTCKSLSD
jgi:hypothetical protein